MIFGNTIPLAGKAMDYLWRKQEITADNIANAETPGYKMKEIKFEDMFRKRLREASVGGGSDRMRNAIQGSKYQVYERQRRSKVDGSNVDVDVESTELARNALQYQYLQQSVSRDFMRLKSAIKAQ